MKRTILFTIIYLLLISSGINAQTESDTVWTKDLWKFGDDITQVEFTPDGKNIAVAIGRGVYIIDKLTGQFVKKFNKYMGTCRNFTFTPDGTKLITSSYDKNYIGKIIVWDYENIDTIKTYNDLDIKKITALDNQTIFGIWNLSDWDVDSNRVCKFNFMTGEFLNKVRLTGRYTYIDGNSFSVLKNKNLFAVVIGNDYNDRKSILLYDLNTYAKIAEIGYHNAVINDLAFSNDGKYLASAGSDGLINVWDLETKTLLKTLNHRSMQNGYLRVKFSPNSGYLVSSGGIGNDFTTKIWDYKESKVVYEYSPPIGATLSLDISSDSNFIAPTLGYRIYLLRAHWLPSEVSISQENNEQELYPNPSGNSIKIPIEKNKIPISISIHSIAGNKVKEIEQFKFPDNNIEIDISDLLQGVYIVTVIYEGKSKSYKFEKMN